jgi:hypothetical protein
MKFDSLDKLYVVTKWKVWYLSTSCCHYTDGAMDQRCSSKCLMTAPILSAEEYETAIEHLVPTKVRQIEADVRG